MKTFFKAIFLFVYFEIVQLIVRPEIPQIKSAEGM